MRFESQTHPQNAHIDGYSTRYGHAPAVTLASYWPSKDDKTSHFVLLYHNGLAIWHDFPDTLYSTSFNLTLYHFSGHIPPRNLTF